jgi:DNA-binding CsgD family transcriptional regulator
MAERTSDRTNVVYRAFLRHPESTPADLAARLDLSERQVSAALTRLTAEGYVRRRQGALVPVRPDAVVEHLLSEEERDLERRRAALAKARTELAAEMDDYFAGRAERAPSEDAETLVGLDAIRRRVDEVLAATRVEMLAIVTDANDSAAAVDAARDEDAAMLGRGVSIRTLYPTSVRDMPNTWAYAAEMAMLGEQIRLVDSVPMRMVIRDRDLVILPVDTEDLDAGVQLLRSPPVVAAFVRLFELCWARATPAFTASADAGERHRQLLDLLATGAKDEAIARRVGVNVRTVRRDIANLIAGLDATTRFEAGVQASRRGWV